MGRKLISSELRSNKSGKLKSLAMIGLMTDHRRIGRTVTGRKQTVTEGLEGSRR